MEWHKVSKPPKLLSKERELVGQSWKNFYESDLLAIRHFHKGYYAVTSLGFYRIDMNYENGHFVDQIDGQKIEDPYEWGLVGGFYGNRDDYET